MNYRCGKLSHAEGTLTFGSQNITNSYKLSLLHDGLPPGNDIGNLIMYCIYSSTLQQYFSTGGTSLSAGWDVSKIGIITKIHFLGNEKLSYYYGEIE